MPTAWFTPVLYATGAVTALPLLQFLAPAPALRLLYKLELAEPAGRFFARHWGLLAASMGGLLLYAAAHPEVRGPVVVAALIEKAGVVATGFAVWNEPHGRGLRLATVFDSCCIVLYGAWLAGL